MPTTPRATACGSGERRGRSSRATATSATRPCPSHTKIASGYWHVADSQSGYTAITRGALAALRSSTACTRGYGFPNHLLVELNLYDFRVRDVPIRPVYNVGEVSGIRLPRVIPTLSWLLFKCYFWRMKEKYVIRDFHPLVFFYALGILMTVVGFVLGVVEVVLRIAGQRDHDADDRPRRAAPDLGDAVHALRHVVRHGVEQGPALGPVPPESHQDGHHVAVTGRSP